jgi:hypothetical protein
MEKDKKLEEFQNRCVTRNSIRGSTYTGNKVFKWIFEPTEKLVLTAKLVSTEKFAPSSVHTLGIYVYIDAN